ncbi:hypothetical protein ABZ705_29805 [Streptomyces sp. NPDC006984]|uniref:hypothetical protein n=1 Tax=Streptomyces sp. NPDC006984 TaxID=3155463 RepID=UPI00340D3642
MSLQDLESALPALLKFRRSKPRGIDWAFIERELGAPLPEDFKELSDFYTGLILDDFLSVHAPDPGAESEFISVAQEFLEDLEDLHGSDMSYGYAPFPELGGLIPWGDSPEGDTWYWKTGQSDPGRWLIVVSGHNDDWVEVDETLTGYLAGLVRGTLLPYALPPNFPGRTPTVAVD